jgi:hypothetical protein
VVEEFARCSSRQPHPRVTSTSGQLRLSIHLLLDFFRALKDTLWHRCRMFPLHVSLWLQACVTWIPMRVAEANQRSQCSAAINVSHHEEFPWPASARIP